MYLNFIKIAFRNILKHKLFSFVNFIGLALSLSVCILITMLLADQYSYDRYNTDADRVYRILHHQNHDGGPVPTMATTPMPLAPELQKNFPGITSYGRFYRGFGNDWIKIGQNINIPISGFYADPKVLEIFQWKLKYGNPTTALIEPFSVVITEEISEKLFKIENPIGETIKVGDLGTYKITGVLAKSENKTHIKVDGLASINTVPILVKEGIFTETLDNWGNYTRGWSYIKLASNVNPEDVIRQLAEIHAKQFTEEEQGVTYELQNLTEINPGPFLGNPIGPGLPAVAMYFLIGLGLIVVTSTCFNYTNLSIARSMTRAKEVGVRKVFGAYRKQVFAQFLIEAVVISILSFGLSLLIIQLLKPAFLALNISELLLLDMSGSWKVYLISFGFSIAIGAIAGFFPSLFHSAVKPLNGLKELSGMKILSKIGLRKTLIVMQFGISLFFIITVLTISSQKNLMLKADMGIETKSIVNVRLNGSDPQLLKVEMEKYPAIDNVSAASFAPATGISTGFGISRNEGEDAMSIRTFAVDENYLKSLDINLIAGRFYNIADNDSKKANEIVLNETAVKALGFKDVYESIGEQLIIDNERRVNVVGVVGDYNYQPLYAKIEPLALQYEPEEYGIVQVRINSENKEAGLAAITQAWAKVNPDLALDYQFLKDEIDFFTDFLFGDLIKIISFISLLALLMACLGLLGIAVFSTESKMKEISIRKVLGASEKSILVLLSKGFFMLLIIATVIITPLAYFVNNLWLDSIAYRVDLGFEIISISVLVVMLIGIFTVGSQTFFAAKSNPVDALRNE